MQTLLTKSPKLLLVVIILVIPLVAVFVVLNYNSNFKNSNYIYANHHILVGNTEITVQVADTKDKQQLGLGKRSHLNESSGMLFPYSRKTIPYFWMKDMLIPLDIIWIAEQKIVGIEQNVPYFPSNIPDVELPTYSPPVPIDYVLEVNAGYSDRHNFKIGDEVKINLD